MRFIICATAPDLASLRRELSRPDAGAVVAFEGCVRNHHEGRAVRELEYEVFAALAEKEGMRILTEAREQYPIFDAICVHRTGRLPPGETAVWVGVAASHRGAAFAACQYIIDTLKARVPVWKKECYSDGDSGWIEPPAAPRPD
jgi:molybdopterin synthase catalytic subunit